MGCCGGKPEQAEVPATSEPQEEKTFKLLLLGAGGSGKSTVFKQVKILFGGGYNAAERKALAQTIHENIVISMKTLVKKEKEMKGEAPAGDSALKPKILDQATEFLKETDDELVSSKKLVNTGEIIKLLWDIQCIKDTYDKRASFQLPTDTIHYFFNKIHDVMVPGYDPSQDDVLRCRIHSSGVKQKIFEMEDIKFRLLDVGGQRSERKKWVQCFENVTAVLYVVAVSEFDQLLYEDNETNRVIEALDLFEDIANSEWFADTPLILFLNKRDLFAEKINNTQLKNYFQDFEGENTYEKGIEFLRREFEQRNQQDREIITQITCATETQEINKVFNNEVKSILDKILKQRLH